MEPQSIDDDLREVEDIVNGLRFADPDEGTAQDIDRMRLLLAKARLSLQHVRELLV